MIINNFLGIAPKFGDNLKPGYATDAEDIDLSGSRIRPLFADRLASANTTKSNSLFRHNGSWVVGNDKYYLNWVINSYDILIYLVSGVPYKKIGTTTATLGQTRLGAPTLAEGAAGSLSDTFTYFITTTRNVGGYTDESGPSATASITVASKKVTVTPPTITDSNVTHWNLYRISNSSGEYQFVVQKAVSVTSYTDNTIDSSLDTAPTVFYTSDQGNEITWDTPQTTFDGMAIDVESGMIMAWSGSELYWNEPGYPDAWPSFYSMNFPADIKRVIPFSGSWAVLTEKGPFRVDGTHPELLTQSKVLGKEPCIGTAACRTPRGPAYLSDSGIVLFNLIQTEVITDANFGETWFKDNIVFDSAFMEENDNMLFLFHSGGYLRADLRNNAPIWTTSQTRAYAAAVDYEEGQLYFLDATGIKEWCGDESSYKTWTWRSGDLIDGRTMDIQMLGVELHGNGNITGTLYVDGLQVATRAITDHKLMRDRQIRPPAESYGRALQVGLTGTGQVDEIITQIP